MFMLDRLRQHKQMRSPDHLRSVCIFLALFTLYHVITLLACVRSVSVNLPVDSPADVCLCSCLLTAVLYPVWPALQNKEPFIAAVRHS